MSWAATAYVKKLTATPDGTKITRSEKMLLFVLADYYNEELKAAWVSMQELAKHALMSERQAQRLCKALSAHGALIPTQRIDPKHGQLSNWYTLPGLDLTRGDMVTPPGDMVSGAGDIAMSPNPTEDKDLTPCHTTYDIPLPEPNAAQVLKLDAQAVLAYLNKVAGRKFREPGLITGCLRRGATVPECVLVIDWWHGWKTIAEPEHVQYFTTKTPFRPENFDVYRASAEAWDLDGRPSPRASPPSRAAKREEANYESTLEFVEVMNGQSRSENIRATPGSTGSDLQRGSASPEKARLLGRPRGHAS